MRLKYSALLVICITAFACVAAFAGWRSQQAVLDEFKSNPEAAFLGLNEVLEASNIYHPSGDFWRAVEIRLGCITDADREWFRATTLDLYAKAYGQYSNERALAVLLLRDTGPPVLTTSGDWAITTIPPTTQ
ncbi:MAG: hypothetical protein WC655_21350 [Candidatus Hydrogenedentales bacterium]|jgi:hypothetical protein